MTLSEFFVVLRARWKVVFATTLLVLGVAAAMLWSTTPVYTAQASFYLAARQPAKAPAHGHGHGHGKNQGQNPAQNPAQNPTQQQGVGNYVVTTDDLNTYVAVLRSPAVMAPLRQRLGLAPGTPIDVSAAVSGQASILDITANSPSPQLAAQIANSTGPQLAAVADQFSALLKATGEHIRATVITPATVPSQPSSPPYVRDMVLALLAGLALGVGLGFVRHSLDTRVRSDSDIKALSKSPVLASLPSDRRRAQGLTIEDEPHGHYVEEVRRLRTNLMFVDVTTGSHSFVVTSALPREGKTTTAINLALAMAQAGGRVLLVDADLRNPSIAQSMGLESSVGLTTVLLGKASIDEVVQNWRGTDLYVMAAGQVPPNPSELLGSEPMRALFNRLSEKFDFILMDSPPLVPVIDAVLLDRLTGGMLVVVAAEQTRKRDLSAAMKSLDTAGAHVSGFAWNMTATSREDARRYGYYHYSVARTVSTNGAGEANDTAVETAQAPDQSESASGQESTVGDGHRT